MTTFSVRPLITLGCLEDNPRVAAKQKRMNNRHECHPPRVSHLRRKILDIKLFRHAACTNENVFSQRSDKKNENLFMDVV